MLVYSIFVSFIAILQHIKAPNTQIHLNDVVYEFIL
jgi:hypothetical protein